MTKIKVGINGLGRRGRCLCRLLMWNDDYEVVAINDPYLTAKEIVKENATNYL